MDESKFNIIFMRFLRGFMAGGIASIVPLLSGLVDLQDPTLAKKTLITLGIAFATGGIQALDKLLRWQEETPTPIDALTNADLSKPTIIRASGKLK